MTKEEVERLLRHGAYDIFNEDKAGTSEAESNNFVQQDIDSILARRSKTIVHDNTGSSSNAAGGTFSKASFKAPKTPDGKEKGTSEDIGKLGKQGRMLSWTVRVYLYLNFLVVLQDIDDPDFWKKMVGQEHLEAGGNALAGEKRKRNQANYSEADFDKKIDGAIVLSDAESSSADYESSSSDGSSDDESPSPMSDDLDPTTGGPTEKKRKKAKKEKARWGGKGGDQWHKSDVQSLVKALQTFGYGCLPSWEEFREVSGLDSVKYSVDGVSNRFSCLLVDLLE